MRPSRSFPPLDLFREADATDDEASRGVIEQNARAIEQRLAAFRIDAKVVGVSQGPAVTQYEVRLGEGIKVSRVVSFEADLAAALKALSVRVVAPIPGRDTVGVEVPNVARQIVVLRELLEQFGQSATYHSTTLGDLAVTVALSSRDASVLGSVRRLKETMTALVSVDELAVVHEKDTVTIDGSVWNVTDWGWTESSWSLQLKRSSRIDRAGTAIVR